MMHRTRRAGVTLIEVLAAIFIMGIGMLSLLTLFPLGALSMAQAIKDDRVAQAARNAEAVAVALDLRHRNQGGWLVNLPANWDGPSRPIFLDPVGKQLGGANLNSRLGIQTGNFTNHIVREDVNFAITLPDLHRLFALPDDLTFDPNNNWAAGPGGTTLGSVQRDGRYSYAYLMRRPRARVTSVVDVAIVVYSGRLLSSSTESAYVVTGQDANSVTLGYTGDRPAVRRGTWLLDVTSELSSANPNATERDNAMRYGPVHGNFYRVVNVTDSSSTELTVELEPTIKGTVKQMVVMENVVEVIQKGTDWRP
jgi:prepilin-type N-terminal cleavage/methylation domain-containing protein